MAARVGPPAVRGSLTTAGLRRRLSGVRAAVAAADAGRGHCRGEWAHHAVAVKLGLLLCRIATALMMIGLKINCQPRGIATHDTNRQPPEQQNVLPF